MVALDSKPGWKLTHCKTISALEIITFTLCAITMLTALIDNNLSMKLFNVSGILALITLVIRGKSSQYSLKSGVLPFAILLLGIVDLVWYSIFKTNDSLFRATYHSYLNTAKILLIGAIIILLAATSQLKINKSKILYLFYSLSFLIAAYAFYIKHKEHTERIDFGIGTATGAAYSILIIGVISALSILYTRKNHPFLFILNAGFVFLALVLTQTRSSIILFPFICAFALVTFYNKSVKKVFFSIIGFIVLLSVLLFIFNKPITDRYNQAVEDINQYNSNNSRTSIGARLAMYEAGVEVFKQAPFEFRSVENRANYTMKLIAKNDGLRGARPFLNVHFHNEIIEAASLKGIAGILATLFFYFALIFAAHYHRSPGLLVLTLAIILTGLSDVIIWSRSIPIIIMTTIALVLMFQKKKEV